MYFFLKRVHMCTWQNEKMCNSSCVNELVIQSPLGINYHFSTCTRWGCNCLKMRTDWLIQCSVCLWVNMHDYTHLCIAVLYSVQVMHSCNAVKGVSCCTLNAPTQNAEHALACALYQNCSENRQRKKAKASEFWSDQGHALLNGNPAIQYFWRIPGKNIIKNSTHSSVD